MDFERTVDVLVAGAGVAGVAAALECARAGLSTALVEKTVLVGGLATTGLVYVYLPLCDGNGTQVTYGIAEELLHVSLRYGPGDVPADWRHQHDANEPSRYRAIFSPASFVLGLDEVLVEAGAELWLDTLVCAPVMEGDRIAGVEVENKSGRGVFRATCVIDATGDADVAFRAGAQCAQERNWPTIWALQIAIERAQRAVAQRDGTPLLDMVILGGDSAGRGAPPGSVATSGTRAEEVTQFVLDSRKLLRDHYTRTYAEGGTNNRHRLYPVALPAMAQFRKTRRIVGQETLSDGRHGRHVADSIGLVADWRKPGHVWEIPYGTLVPTGVKGLLAAGRCISSDGDAWEVTRVIPPAVLTGQVAGLGATLAVRNNTTPDALDTRAIQHALRDKGMPLHLGDVGL